jgi:uncharacterized protein (DUF433 family)
MMSRITLNPEQCGGRPCIRGMRIRVKDVLDLLAAGLGEADILADYPDLEAADIRACLAYAAEEADHPVLDQPLTPALSLPGLDPGITGRGPDLRR